MLSLRIYGFPVVSVLYVSFLVVMLLFALRRHLCTNCYYYDRWCSMGWGKISAIIFEKSSGNYWLGVKLAKVTWILVVAVPLVGISIVLLFSYSFLSLVFFVMFIFLTVVNFASHSWSCERCKMRVTCPLSIARRKWKRCP